MPLVTRTVRGSLLSHVAAGVFDDYWFTGYKKERPYTVTWEGKYHGRFATVEQAAVHFARVEAQLPFDATLAYDPDEEEGAACDPTAEEAAAGGASVEEATQPLEEVQQAAEAASAAAPPHAASEAQPSAPLKRKREEDEPEPPLQPAPSCRSRRVRVAFGVGFAGQYCIRLKVSKGK